MIIFKSKIQSKSCKIAFAILLLSVGTGFTEENESDYSGPVETSCKTIGALAKKWDNASEQWPEIYLKAAVKATHAADPVKQPIAVTELCPEGKLSVLCLEYDNNALKPGDLVEVSGMLTNRFEGGVVIDPCSSRLQEAETQIQ